MSPQSFCPRPIKTGRYGAIYPKGLQWPKAPKSVQEPTFWVDVENSREAGENQTIGCAKAGRRNDLHLDASSFMTPPKTEISQQWPEAPRAGAKRKLRSLNPRVLRELDINRLPLPKRLRTSCNSPGI